VSAPKEPSTEAQAFARAALDGCGCENPDHDPGCLCVIRNVALLFDQHVSALRERVQELERSFGVLQESHANTRKALEAGSFALRARLAKADDLAAALALADAHVGWGDCSLENVHRIIRAALAAYRGEEGKL
jgi:hypothetical protein